MPDLDLPQEVVTSIIGRDAYTTAAIIVPYCNVNGELHLLFEQRASGIVQGGEICFPGGVFEASKDRSTKDTAVRETCEELGLEKNQIVMDGYIGTVMALRGVVVDCFLARLTIGSIADCVIDNNEVGRLFTIPVSHFVENHPRHYPLRTEVKPYIIEPDGTMTVLFPAKKLGLPEKYWHPWGSRDHRVLLYPTPYGPVWGLTAEIVLELVRLLVKKDTSALQG